MNAYGLRAGPLLAVVTVVALATAGVPPVMYLMPDQFTASLDQPVTLRVESGAALTAQTAQWPSNEMAWFFVLADGTRHNHDQIAATDPDKKTVAVELTQPGATVIGFDTKPVISQVSGKDLAAFLTKNVAGAEASPAVRELTGRQNLRVRRTQSATTMIRVPAGDHRDLNSAVAQAKTGLSVEIRSMFDPTVITVGSDFPLRTYIGGSKKAGVKVQATSLTGGKTWSKVTDTSGVAYFRIKHPGTWRIEFHHAQPLENDPQADWAVYSATLTFEVATEGSKK